MAFITKQGLFEPTVMFFGLTNSPATFQTMMNTIFAEEITEGWLILYMDDIPVATKDNQEFHNQCVHWMLKKLKKHDLYLKPEKCIFDQKRIEFLGVILEDGTVQMDPAKVKGVADWPPLQNVTDMLIPGIYRILSLFHTELLAHCQTHDPVNMKKHPIQLGSIQHPHVRTPQITNVHKTNIMTTQLHEGLLPSDGRLCLWCGHCTLAGGRTEPLNQTTNALPSSLLLKHIHAN